MFMLVNRYKVGNAMLVLLSFMLFSIWKTPVWLWWPSVVSRMPYWACSWCTSGFYLLVLWCVYFLSLIWLWYSVYCSWKC